MTKRRVRRGGSVVSLIRLVNNLINKEIIHCEENFFHRGREIPSEQNRPILPTSGADLGRGYRECASLPPFEMTCGFLIQLVFCINTCLRHQSVTPFLWGATPPPPPFLRKILVTPLDLRHNIDLCVIDQAWGQHG